MPSSKHGSGSRGLPCSVALAALVVALSAFTLPARESRTPRLRAPDLDRPRVEIYPGPLDPRDPVKRAVFEGINRDRVEAGLPPVAWDEAASRVADDFCARQVAERTRGHFLMDGVPPYARMGFAGVFGMQSENSVSWITTSMTFSEPLERLALEGHEQMMGEKSPSDGHRRTILDPAATHAGVGYRAAGGRFQMAQEFLVRRLERLTLSPVSPRSPAVFFEGRPVGTQALQFVTVAWEEGPRPLSREEASARTSYAYPTPAVSYISERDSLMQVVGTRSEDRLRIRLDHSFFFRFVPARAGLYTFVFYTATHRSSSARPGGAAALWFE